MDLLVTKLKSDEDPSHGHDAGQAFDLEAVLHRVSHWLPAQGPIKDFIHHNTLHAFQNLPFDQGVVAASKLFGARAWMDKAWYLERYRSGGISSTAIDRVLAMKSSSASERKRWLDRMLQDPAGKSMAPPGIAKTGIRSLWLREKNIDLDLVVHPMLFKLLAGFLDQGIAIWRMPSATQSLWGCIASLVKDSWLPVPPLSDVLCREILALSPKVAIERCLQKLVGKPEKYETYLTEMLLSHPGWSGMVAMVEAKPGSLLTRRKITLEEFVALELTMELGWITRHLGEGFTPLGSYSTPPVAVPDDADAMEITFLWQEAFEWSFYENLLGGLEAHSISPQPAVANPTAQAYFCIDEREGGLRRHLEEIEPKISTYGSAGFFGIDFLYQGIDDAYPVQLCPVVLTPKHLVREVARDPKNEKRPKLNQMFHFNPSSNTLVRGWLTTQVLGVFASVKLAISLFRPREQATAQELSHVDAHTNLHLLRESDEPTPEGLLIGYSIQEMVDRVYGVFRSTGLTSSFSRLVVFVAHGSSSVNNPHFAAYDCGACSGRPGAPNARAIASMANNPDVREGLRRKGLDIPSHCHVIGSLHDTTRDEITYFGLDRMPDSHRPDFEAFQAAMTKALVRNSKERTRRFALVEKELTPLQAQRAVRQRAASIFEPRPELNHATNSSAIVGRREMTRGLFLDRRAFMNSYDPTQDPKGDVLAGILGAVIPVCGGINLEYFFSRVDSSVYGAGTKLPHNVVGLFGVANGVEGDLMTGLPTQMTEVHDPVRLIVVVEQEPAVALSAVTRNPAIYEWVRNGWVRFACFSPTDKRSYWLVDGEFVAVAPADKTLTTQPDSLSIAQGEMENISLRKLGGRL